MFEILRKEKEQKNKKIKKELTELLIQKEVLTPDGKFGKNANDTNLIDDCIKQVIKNNRNLEI